jgi:hypothetical protein
MCGSYQHFTNGDGVNRLYGYNIVVPSTNLVNTLVNNDPRLEEWIDQCRNESFRTSTRISIESIGEPTNYSRRAEDYFLLKQKYLPYS